MPDHPPVNVPDDAPNAWPYRLAVMASVATFILILFGGLVTGLGVGLAVPDWPSTFGHNMFLFPLDKMVGGVFYEHTHRLIGSLVGLATVALAVALWVAERRRWLRVLGIVAVALVVVQGVLGGLRVIWLRDGMALVHGIVAQGFFALVVSLAVVTAKAWREAQARPPQTGLDSLRRLALLLAGAAYLQVAFGAVLTHTGTRLDAHLTFAAVVSVLVILVARRVLADRQRWPDLARTASLLHALWGVQLLLGAAAYLMRFHGGDAAFGLLVGLAIRVAHRLTGALLLAAAVAVAAWAYRLSGTAEPVASGVQLPGQATA